MSLQQEISKIKAGNLAPIYLVLGEERYLSDMFKQALLDMIVKTEDDELNTASFDMKETTLAYALEESNTIPFFGEYRLVGVENPFFLTGEKNKSGIEHNTDELITYLEEPSLSTVLVFYAPYEKLDERKKIVKLLKKKATLIDVSKMEERDVKNYTQQVIKNEGYEISPEAFELFLYLTDMELSKIMGELTKIFLFASDTKQITKDMVENLVPKSLEHNIFAMINYVVAGQSDKALMLYKDLLLQGEETIKINSILIGQFRLLLQLKIMQASGYQQSNMLDVIGGHPFRIKKGIQQVKAFDMEELKRILGELVENDYKMKTGQLSKELVFELFILKFGKAK